MCLCWSVFKSLFSHNTTGLSVIFKCGISCTYLLGLVKYVEIIQCFVLIMGYIRWLWNINEEEELPLYKQHNTLYNLFRHDPAIS